MNLKRIFLLILLLQCKAISAQDIVNWESRFDQEKNSILITATIAEGWHLYSQHIENNVGPVPTSFTFMSSNDYTLKGRVIEPKAIQKYDENFEATLDFFEKEVTFTQKIVVAKASTLKGTITFMVCNETMCLPPVDKKIELALNK